jgi:mannose-6-phosphate isomerase-like protein (cupin superfamily)
MEQLKVQKFGSETPEINQQQYGDEHLFNEKLKPGAGPAEIKVSLIDSVWCKQMNFRRANDYMLGHIHTHDHTTLVAAGSFLIVVNGEETVVKAPTMVFVHKDHYHHLIALEDESVAYCIHALRDYTDGDIIDPSTIPKGVTPRYEPIITNKRIQGKC